MATLTLNPKMVVVTGLGAPMSGSAAAANGTNGSAGTVYIQPTTAQTAVGIGLDLSRMIVRIENQSVVTTTVTIKAGSGYSAIGVGDSAAITIGACTNAAATNVMLIGGADFESARYLDSSGRLRLDFGVSAVTAFVEAYQLPR